ncbi:MAG: hypothetical protein ACI9DO_002263 [Reinekea sp.]|jgi:hypothetical protein
MMYFTIVPCFKVLSVAKAAYTKAINPIMKINTMAKALPKFLTSRQQAHKLISQLQFWQIKYQGWRDARSALKAFKKATS